MSKKTQFLRATAALLVVSLLSVTGIAIAAVATTNTVVNQSNSNTYSTIQAAVDDANSGDVIVPGEGTYKEQITIDKPLTLRGAEGTTVVIEAIANQLGASIKVLPGTTNVNLENLVVRCIPAEQTATGCQGGDNRLAGIWFQEASGTVDSVSVVDFRKSTGLLGCQEGNGIQIRGNTFENVASWDNTLSVMNSVVSGYQKTGILGNGNVKIIVSGNTVTGLGPVNFIAQNGVQIGFGATGVVEFNVISGNDYTPASFTSCGILFFDASGVRCRQNMKDNNERPLGNFGRGGGDVQSSGD